MLCHVVEPSSSDEMRQRVFRLRHRIYVQEMRLPVSSEEGLLRDVYDDAAISLLLTDQGEDIGTLRIMPKRAGMMEVEEQSGRWLKAIKDTGIPDERICEWNRFMVVRSARGGVAAPALFYHAFHVCSARGFRYTLAAGKLGSLTKNYMKYSAKVLDAQPLPYILHGYDFGRYILLLADIGQKG